MSFHIKQLSKCSLVLIKRHVKRFAEGGLAVSAGTQVRFYTIRVILGRVLHVQQLIQFCFK